MGAQIGALVLATSGVQLAVGFFGTFISLRVPLENFTATMSAHDSMHGEQVVAVSGRLILLFGLGSILGPLLGTSFVVGFGINGVL
jgi:hypothetical protein